MAKNKYLSKHPVLKIFATIIFIVLLAFFLLCFCPFRANLFPYFSLCIIFLCIIFVVASVLFIVAMFGKKFRKGAAIICAAVAILIVPCIQTADYILSQPYRTFDTALWNDGYQYYLRQYMVDDLDEKIIGMDIEEVQKLLGHAEKISGGIYDYIEYYVGDASFFSIRKYRIYYDACHKVVKTKLVGFGI